MLKKINISESEREKILNLHKVLKEATGLSIGGKVLDLNSNQPIFDAKVTLTLSNATKGMAKTDADGNFKFDGLSSGEYAISGEAKSQGYVTMGNSINLVDEDILDFKILLSPKVTDIQGVDTTVTKLAVLDFIFVDSDGKDIPNVSYSLYDNKKKLIGTYTSETGRSRLMFNGFDYQVKKGETITYPENKERGYFYSPGKTCEEQKELIVITKIKGYIETKQKINFCLNNGSYSTVVSKEEGNITVTPTDSESGIPTKSSNHLNSNIFKTELLAPKISAKLSTFDTNDKILPNVKIDVYKDKDRQELFQSLETNQNGETNLKITTGNFELFNDENDPVKKVRLFFDVRKDGYKPMSGYGTIKYGKEDTYSWNLVPIKVPKVKEPKPPKEIKIGECRRLTKSYHRDLVSIIRKETTISELGGNDVIDDNRNQVQWCFMKYKDSYSENMRKLINKLTNVPPSLDIFELRFTLQQQRDIYKENRDMGIGQTIRKAISEQVEKKSLLNKESNLIKKRLLFVLESSNRRHLKTNLLSESRELISKGYDRKLVKENFLEIMNTMKDSGKDFISDVKNQLGQKIADTVKDKQQEHEMILTAFKELDPQVVERAFKENRTDELSEIISKKALEDYKNQFGEGGIFGSIVASVDPNKFKTEVAKLVQTAIDAISTEMDSKVQDAVGGED
jgi:hypothetical protein